jgi:hypothetical protein
VGGGELRPLELIYGSCSLEATAGMLASCNVISHQHKSLWSKDEMNFEREDEKTKLELVWKHDRVCVCSLHRYWEVVSFCTEANGEAHVQIIRHG